MRLWHIAALLVIGVAVGALFPGKFTAVFGPATLYVFLPALIFEGAWHLDARLMRGSWRAIAMLAIPGVILTAGIIALFAHYFASFVWISAGILGVILSATDPVAVVAIFRRIPIPKRLATIVESEALLNDAIAVVLYRALLGASLPGAVMPWKAAGQAAIGVVLGVALGVALAACASFLLRRPFGTTVQCAATFLGAYGGYFIAERLAWSGIFAVIAFSITLRELERTRISVACAMGVGDFWDAIATLANLFLFFLIGAALDFTRLGAAAPAAGVVIAAVLVSRIAVAYGLLHFVRSQVKRVWQTVVRMAGIRGALALALALATPSAIAQRNEIISATFAVVLVTVLAGSLTLDKRIRRLPLQSGGRGDAAV